MDATASCTRLSKVGVWTCGLPRAPKVSNRCWSVQYQRMLGHVVIFSYWIVPLDKDRDLLP